VVVTLGEAPGMAPDAAVDRVASGEAGVLGVTLVSAFFLIAALLF
jgi:hypothetical protein